MSPVQRPVSGKALTFALVEEMRIVREQLGAASRIARTLVKNGPLRATLVGLGPGAALTTHTAGGPITIQVLEGAVDFEADGRQWSLPAGSMLALGAGVAHGARSATGGFFLLTVVASASDAPDQPAG